MVSKRAKVWRLKTSPELFNQILESKHSEASKAVEYAYTEIDNLYNEVAKILDRYGIFGNIRLLYRCYMEELYRASKRFSGKALENASGAIYSNFFRQGADYRILREIAKEMGIKIPLVGLDYCILG